jgi:cell division initiation protein
MRLNHLDILEQCFRDKIFGYNKEDVDTFLHLVAEDFKEITEELDLLKKEINKKNRDTDKFNEQDTNKAGERKNDPIEITPEIIKEKAKRIISAAREHANQHKKEAERELSNLKREIEKIRQEKKTLIATIKMSVQESHVLQKNKK